MCVALIFLAVAYPDVLLTSGVVFAMAVPVKDVATAAAKFVKNGSAAGEDYANGVRGAGQRWQTNAAAGEQNFAQGVQDAIARKAFSKGIQESGAAHYEQQAITVGAQRFPQGIRAAQQAWQDGTAPFIQAIASANLPPRGPKGDPRNQARSQMMAEILRKKKVSG
jgi:hypothetical protein